MLTYVLTLSLKLFLSLPFVKMGDFNLTLLLCFSLSCFTPGVGTFKPVTKIWKVGDVRRPGFKKRCLLNMMIRFCPEYTLTATITDR